jgi:nucleotide-binding universal stress UspA family protein
MPFTNIVVAYDSSNLSKKALNKAIELAKENASKLDVVHVYQIPAYVTSQPYYVIPTQEELEKAAESVTNEIQELIKHVPNSNSILIYGQAAKSILDYANNQKCDLIVMGSRGLGGLEEFVLGSVSHNVAQHSKVPVLIIK